MHITVTCPECEGTGVKVIYLPESPTVTLARKLHADALRRLAAASEDPFSDNNEEWHMANTYEQKKFERLHAALREQGPTTKHTPCPKCHGAGTAIVPTSLESLLGYIVSELARLDKEQTGGEPNAKRIYKALESL